MPQGLSGVTPDSGGRFILDSGAVYINLDIEALETAGADPVGTAIASPAISLGATRGGASFNPGHALRVIPIDGTLGPTKGFIRRTSGSGPTLTVNLIEMTVDNLSRAIAGLVSETTGEFTKITSGAISDDTYLDNVAIVTTFMGSETPIVLVIANAMAHEAPVMSMTHGDEVVLAVTFTGHINPNTPGTPAWTIYHPGESPAS